MQRDVEKGRAMKRGRLRGFASRQTDEQTFVIVELLLQISARNYFDSESKS